jgi:hypothetical protein
MEDLVVDSARERQVVGSVPTGKGGRLGIEEFPGGQVRLDGDPWLSEM